MLKFLFSQPIYWIISLVAIVCLLTYGEIESLFWSTFVKDLGMAGIIALILTFTIESFNRKRHELSANALVEKINQNLFEAVYKRLIPPEIFAEVEKCLLRSNVYRTNHEVCYSLEAMPAQEDNAVDVERHLLCTATSSYKLHNSTGSEIEHKVILKLERPLNPDWDDKCKVTKVKIGAKVLSDDEIIAGTDQDAAHFTFSEIIKIVAGGSIIISTEAKLIKQRVDQETWSSRLPSTGLDLTVTTSDPLLIVNAYANHNEKLEEHRLNDLTTRWKLNYGMFPHQSVTFWWKER